MEKRAIWRRAFEQGKAAELADLLVASRPVPEKLFEAILGQPKLTKRELVIVSALSHGYREREIAEMMGVAYETIRSRVAILRLKLGAKTLGHLVGEAYRRGILS